MSIKTLDKRFGEVVDTDFSAEARPFAKYAVKADTGSEALALAGLDWPVVKVPIYAEGGLEIPGRMATVRGDLDFDDPSKVLGVVGTDYQVVQNREAFAFIDELLAAGAKIDAAGAIGNGRRVWIRLSLPGAFTINGEQYLRRLLAWTGHDGYSSIRMAAEIYRLICLNGMMAIADSAYISIAHTSNARSLVREAQHSLEWAERQYEQVTQQLQFLLGKPIAPSAQEWLKLLVPPTMTKHRTTGELQVSGRGENIRLRILDRLCVSPAIKGHRGDLYGMVQAVSEYTDHDRVKSASPEAALKTMWWGSSQSLKQRALELALAS